MAVPRYREYHWLMLVAAMLLIAKPQPRSEPGDEDHRPHEDRRQLSTASLHGQRHRQPS